MLDVLRNLSPHPVRIHRLRGRSPPLPRRARRRTGAASGRPCHRPNRLGRRRRWLEGGEVFRQLGLPPPSGLSEGLFSYPPCIAAPPPSFPALIPSSVGFGTLRASLSPSGGSSPWYCCRRRSLPFPTPLWKPLLPPLTKSPNVSLFRWANGNSFRQSREPFATNRRPRLSTSGPPPPPPEQQGG